MKSILTLILILPCLLHSQSLLRLQPERPVASGSLTIRYQPSAAFANSPAESLIAEVLVMGPAPIVLDVTLRPQSRWFNGSFEVPVQARALFIRIVSHSHIDDRNGNCWSFPIVDRSGTPVAGSRAQLSAATRLGGQFGFSVSCDLNSSAAFAEQERLLYSDSSDGWVERWRTILARENGSSNDQLRTELDSLLRSWSDRQQAICELLPFLEMTGQHARALELERVWFQRDQRGPIALRVAWREASNEPDPGDRLEKIERLLKNFAITPDDDVLQLLVYTSNVAEQWDKADEYIHRMPRKEPTLMDALVRRLLAAKTTVDRAGVLAKEAVNASKNYDPALKPARMPLREYRRQRARELPMALRTYGDALTALGYTALAEKAYAEAKQHHE